jgi:hypothetical protein
MLWVIYVCSDVLNEHEWVCREHAYGPHDLQADLYGSADTTLNYASGTGDPGSIPGALFISKFFGYPGGLG